MKQFKFFLLSVISLLYSISMSAHDFEVDGIYYNITSATDKTVEVTYRGDKYNSYSNEYSGAVNILEIVNYNGVKYNVTRIGEYTFSSCSDLTSVEIPNSVFRIDKYAFYGCSNLTSVVIPNSVTSIGEYAFSGCSSLTSMEIPNGMTSIGEYTFYDCSSLTSVKIPNSVTNIGNSAFSGCSSLTSVEIPNSVTNIGNNAFSGCSSLVSVKIPNSVTNIGNRAFYKCSSLTSVEISESVKSIRNSAFEYCTGLTFVNITDVASWCKIDFGNSSSNPLYYAKQLYLNGEKIANLVIPDGVTSIEGLAFYKCSGLSSVEIPNSVKSIGNGAFDGCSGLTFVNITDVASWCKIDFGNSSSNPLYYAKQLYLNGEKIANLVIPDGVTSIEGLAFYKCSGLTSVEIPNSVTNIGSAAFDGCSGLTSVEIPNSVTNIGSGAFDGCSGLTFVNITDVASWCKIDFGNSSSNPLYYAKQLYLNGEKITNLVIPDSVTSIGTVAFYNCSGLTSVVIPNSMTSIEKSAFSGCKKIRTVVNYSNLNITKGSSLNGEVARYAYRVLSGESINGFYFGGIDGAYTLIGYWGDTKDLILPNNYKGKGYRIESNAFRGCSDLTSVVIPNSVTSIGDGAFSGCSGLTSVVIPNSVTSIEENAFEGCSNLNSVELDTESIDSWFSSNKSLSTLVFGDNVKIIGNKAFSYCSSLTSVEIPNNVTSIGNGAFEYCTGLTFVEIPNSVTSIGKSAFGGCSGLNSVKLDTDTIDSWFSSSESLSTLVLGNNVKIIGDYAFSNCSSLTYVDIPNSVTSIGVQAFWQCYSLTSVDIPNSVTSIRRSAFSYCSSLISVEIPNSVKSIERSAFAGCSGLISIIIPNSVTSIEEYALSNCFNLTSVTSYIPASNLFPISNVFKYINKNNCTLYVRKGAKEVYKSTAGWNEFENIVEIKIDTVQVDEQGVMYKLNTDTDAFEVMDYSDDLSTDIVLPATIDGLPLRIITAEVFKDTDIKSIVIPATIQEVGDDAFVGCTELRWVDWQAQAQARAECFDAPEVHGNMLLFCYGEQAPDYAGNVVVNGKAKEIVLMDARPYASPYDYEAENISFTKTFTKETMIGTGAGWEGIVVPFDVERIVFGDKVIAPFGATGQYSDIPCWLAQMKDENFVMTDAIKADEAYIMAVPNSEAYDDDYNVEGDVRFEATKVRLKATSQMPTTPSGGLGLVGTYEPVEAAANVFTLNDEEYWKTYDGMMAPGSVFVQGLRDVRPFEAYVRSTKALQMACLKIGSVLPTHITSVQSGKTDAEAWYTLQGKRLNTKPVQTGFYLHGGKLEFVRQR